MKSEDKGYAKEDGPQTNCSFYSGPIELELKIDETVRSYPNIASRMVESSRNYCSSCHYVKNNDISITFVPFPQ